MTNQAELIPMMPGDILRHKREKKGFTLEKAAQLSGIKLSVLAAIECSETSEIPSVYLRGYVRNYARFLGVKTEILDQNMHCIQGSEPELRSVFQGKKKRADSERWLKATSYFAASALIATLAWQFTHEAVRFSQGDSNLTSGTMVTDQTGSTNGSSDATAAYPTQKHLNASIASMEVLRQRQKPGAESNAPLAGPALGSPGAIGSDVVSTDSGLDSKILQVTTSADTWVEILDADGVQLEMDLIRADESRDYTGSLPFSILVGRASAVRLNFDGQAVDLAPYARGNVARMTLGGDMSIAAGQQTDTSQR